MITQAQLDLMIVEAEISFEDVLTEFVRNFLGDRYEDRSGIGDGAKVPEEIPAESSGTY